MQTLKFTAWQTNHDFPTQAHTNDRRTGGKIEDEWEVFDGKWFQALMQEFGQLQGKLSDQGTGNRTYEFFKQTEWGPMTTVVEVKSID